MLAVYNEQDSAVPEPNTTTMKIDGTVKAYAVEGSALYAGMPSVNQANPNLIAFAGQNVATGTYDQNENYIWVVDTSQPLAPGVNPIPLETGAPGSGSFDWHWQGRAPYWSPDGKWVAFESYRASPPPPGQPNGGLYAIYLYEYGGTGPAIKVTDPMWNSQHAKWFPNGFPGLPSGAKTLIVAAYQQPDPPTPPAWPFGIASLNVSSIVG
jgi:hypothetical protein